MRELWSLNLLITHPTTLLDLLTIFAVKEGLIKCFPFICKAVKKLIKSDTTQDPGIIYSTTRVGDHFAIKDGTPRGVLSRVVYKFTCPGDPDTSYIGFTTRLLSERVKEHTRGGTAVSYHLDSCVTCKDLEINVDNFQILKKCRSRSEPMIFEAIFIKRQNPKLNRQLIKPGISHTLQIF